MRSFVQNQKADEWSPLAKDEIPIDVKLGLSAIPSPLRTPVKVKRKGEKAPEPKALEFEATASPPPRRSKRLQEKRERQKE